MLGDMSDSVDFRWAPSPADWRSSLRAMVPMFRWAPWFALVLGGFSLILLFFFDDMVPVGAVRPGLCALVIGFMEPVAVWWRFSSDEMISRTVVGSADDQSFRMAVGTAVREEMAWAELPGWTETRRGFVLETLDEGAASLSVPLRAFASDEDAASFRDAAGTAHRSGQVGVSDRAHRVGRCGRGHVISSGVLCECHAGRVDVGMAARFGRRRRCPRRPATWAEQHEVVADDDGTATALDLPGPDEGPRRARPAARLAEAVPARPGVGWCCPYRVTCGGWAAKATLATCALRAGEALAIPSVHIGLVPKIVADGVMRWTVFDLPSSNGLEHIPIGEAEHGLGAALREATAALASLDVAKHRPNVRQEIADLSARELHAAVAGR